MSVATSQATGTPVTAKHPALVLLQHYRAVFAAAWAMRNEVAGPRRLADETAFLPAALSLQETPPHPAPRRLALVIGCLFLLVLAWSLIGRIDIVAVAPGRTVVGERTKTLQPLEAGVIRHILVKDGDSVQAGQVLVELDATHTSADMANVLERQQDAAAERARTSVLIRALGDGSAAKPPPSRVTTGTEHRRDDMVADARLRAEWQDIAAKLARLDAERARRQAEIATVGELVAKLRATLPIARQREADFKGLAEQGFMSSHAGQDRSRDRIEQERDLAMQQARLAEARAALAEANHARSAYAAETLRILNDRLAQATLQHRQLTQELGKAEQRSRLTRLTAPVDGTVQQVAVHTEGGVVTPAQALMVIVPRDAQLTAEVVVDNRDIGFVHAGQEVTVKLETFPFTRYGTVPATVKSISADAVTDDKRGAIFLATLTLDRNHIEVEGKRIGLGPGMNVTAEIRTGERVVIDYLLGPVRKVAGESLRER